ncbi:hypothetical protein CKO40_10670 [Halochromatium glycolicum]|uniref:Uncharacterized protein n=1 Tax=Halochromatium glycolicum TaxID=85075 RepID=A0AAJ0XAC0_9GAMM|nr:hypothetical protein [Halochromatium glycolicum]
MDRCGIRSSRSRLGHESGAGERAWAEQNVAMAEPKRDILSRRGIARANASGRLCSGALEALSKCLASLHKLLIC